MADDWDDDEAEDREGPPSMSVDPLSVWGAWRASKDAPESDQQVSPLILVLLLGLPIALLITVAIISK